MTREEIYGILRSTGLPCAFDHFDEREADRPDGPPFICFLLPELDSMAADDIAYVTIARLVVELYTDNVDFTLEAALEAALDAAELICSKSQTFIEAEKMYQTTYTTEVLLTDE